jgi:hypothetical protein
VPPYDLSRILGGKLGWMSEESVGTKEAWHARIASRTSKPWGKGPPHTGGTPEEAR